VSQPYASGGSPSAWTVYTYDGLGRTIKTVQPDGASTTTYAYSGNQTTVTDPAGSWKQFTKDVLGNLTTVVEPDPANQPGGTLTTTYTYDWMNHVSGITMTRGSTTQTRTFVYNDTGTLASATNPENGTVNYTYNSLNLLTAKIDAKGQETDYTYDSKNRLILMMQYPYGKSNYTWGCSYVAYAWDGTLPVGSAFTSQYNTGRLTTVNYGTIPYGNGIYSCRPSNSASYYLNNPSYGYVETYSYHPAGGIIDKELWVNPLYPGSNQPIAAPAALDVYYTFNQAGQIATTTYPTTGSQFTTTYNNPQTFTYTPSTFTYAYDTMGRPNSLIVNSPFAINGYLYPPSQNKWVQNVTYDYAGRQSSLQYWDGNYNYVTESKTWNGSGHLASVLWGGTGMQYSYSSTQNNGQITQAVDAVSGETIVYQYDLLKRLVSASATPTAGSGSAAWTETFQYDGFGNLTQKTLNGTATPIPVNAATNQLANAYYDANGNMTSGAGASLTYDTSNRLTSAYGSSGGAETYEYAPDNKRIHRTVAGSTPPVNEWTFYGANGEKLGVYQLAQGTDNYGNAYAFFAPVRTSVWFGGKLVYENGPVNLDRLGTNHAQSAQFLPYGDEITSTSNDRTKFATYTRDSYTGLDYADQRFYASTYGRFNTADPAQSSADPNNPGSWNRYGYTLGDPVNGNDPTGLCDVVIAGIAQNSVNATDVQNYASNNNAISVYPYSGDSDASGVASSISSAFSGIIQVATQAFGANSSTFAAVEGLAEAAQDGNPINVTTFSGGAGAFTTAVNFLNANGGSGITGLINNITYVAPGMAGNLYNNGNVTWVQGGVFNGVVAAATSIPQKPAPPQFLNDAQNCGHNFGCLAREFAGRLKARSGAACSNPTVINQPNNSGLMRMFIPNYGDPLWWQSAWFNQAANGSAYRTE
jgi:RHS repeat-associated protein